ncbi:MAG: peptidase T4 [Hyphomicrobiales bacterium]|nr:MAG: peptidase T4 [Hyphomicrobiales bacterium]
MTIKPGLRNSLSDIAGLTVGNAASSKLKSGVTVVLCEEPTIASVHVMGGGPGTRDTELLSPKNLVEGIDALVLSGGSAFGLDAASGVQAMLREQGRGFAIGPVTVPIVPAAILFDLTNGGDKDWGEYPPYRELGKEAALAAREDFAIGSEGAGYGAKVAGLKGGLGTASLKLDNGITIAALAAVNAVGSPIIADTGHFWAAPFEIDGEFGNRSLPSPLPDNAAEIQIKHRTPASSIANTTIAVIATDAVLTKAQAERLAIASHDGFARALWPVHTPLDGDLIFSLATGKSDIVPDLNDWLDIGAYAASVMSRAIARGIYEASSEPNDLHPSWQEKYGR